MAKPGPKPKPSALNDLQGNPGKRARNKQEPKPESEVKRPWGLPKGPRKFWDEHADELERIGVLTGVDVPAFRMMAEAYVFALEAADQLREEGLTVETRNGPRKHPAAQIWRDNANLFKSFAVEFGLTPSSRTRVHVPEEAEQLSLVDELFQVAGQLVGNEQDAD